VLLKNANSRVQAIFSGAERANWDRSLAIVVTVDEHTGVAADAVAQVSREKLVRNRRRRHSDA